MLEYRDIEIIAFPFYFFVNCLREVRNMTYIYFGIGAYVAVNLEITATFVAWELEKSIRG